MWGRARAIAHLIRRILYWEIFKIKNTDSQFRSPGKASKWGQDESHLQSIIRYKQTHYLSKSDETYIFFICFRAIFSLKHKLPNFCFRLIFIFNKVTNFSLCGEKLFSLFRNYDDTSRRNDFFISLHCY